MKFLATLAASSYAAAIAVSGVTAPTAITSGETENTATFPGSTGVWTWMLYGATAADEDGYYLKIVTSAASKNATLTATVRAWADWGSSVDGTLTGQEVGLIKYLVVADETNSGAEISWTVTYDGADAATEWTAVALTQTFGAAASVSATGDTALAFSANTGANAWVLYAYDDAFWTDAIFPSSTMGRLTPDESTTTDARPVVGEAATAYYLTQAVATGTIVNANGLTLTGAVTSEATPTVALTWAGAASLSAAAATVAVAALF